MKFIILVFLLGFLIRMIARYVIPIFRVTSAAGSQMRQMQEKMREMENKMNQPASAGDTKKKGKKEGDYIDYEEVR